MYLSHVTYALYISIMYKYIKYISLCFAVDNLYQKNTILQGKIDPLKNNLQPFAQFYFNFVRQWAL